MALFDIGLAKQVDLMCTGIREKLETESSQSDISRFTKLMRTFKAHDKTSCGSLDFPSFTDAMVDLNIVGPQRAIKALFSRFDPEAQGGVRYDRMSKRILCMRPDGERNPQIRNTFALLRRAASGLGLHGLSMAFQMWESYDEAATGVITRKQLDEGLRKIGLIIRETDIIHIYAEFDTAYENKISISELSAAARGILSRRRRMLIDRAWANVTDGAVSDSIDFERISAYLKLMSPSWLTEPQAITHLALAFPNDKALFEDFLRLHQDFSAMIVDDEAFGDFMRDSWNIDPAVDPSLVVLPGTIEAVLQDSIQRENAKGVSGTASSTTFGKQSGMLASSWAYPKSA